jgi:hypothetical protein
MQLVRRLIQTAPPSSLRRRLSRGLSTAELVGIIVIVGVLGALGGTYINGLVGSAKTNSGNQNAQTLNTVLSSAWAAGAVVDDGTHSPGMIDCSTSANAVAQLCGNGVVVNGVTYKMNPPVGTQASYTLANAGAGATTLNTTFSYTGTAP